jgi:hypothetical protein
MDSVDNPFRPGAGRRPPVLAGRETLLHSFDVVKRRVATYGEGDRSWVLNGLRGVGKTVVLNELLRQAGEAHWIAAKVEVTATTPLPVAISSALLKALRTATGRHPEPPMRRLMGVFKSFSLRVDPTGAIGFGIDVDPVDGFADTGRFSDDLAALFEVLGETSLELGIGTLILVDELQEAHPDELIAINTAVHHIGQADQPLPVIFVGAGLPSLPAQLADATSYAERLYDYRSVALLDADAARLALTEATRARGVEWDEAALDAALEVSGGYPYFIQAVGKHVWDVAPGPGISREDVAVGGGLAKAEVYEGLYRSRWERATTVQKHYLRAMAELGGDDAVGVGELVAHLGKRRASDLSVPRNELIRKGLVYPPERGVVAFTVPGMAEFIEQQT